MTHVCETRTLITKEYRMASVEQWYKDNCINTFSLGILNQYADSTMDFESELVTVFPQISFGKYLVAFSCAKAKLPLLTGKYFTFLGT